MRVPACRGSMGSNNSIVRAHHVVHTPYHPADHRTHSRRTPRVHRCCTQVCYIPVYTAQRLLGSWLGAFVSVSANRLYLKHACPALMSSSTTVSVGAIYTGSISVLCPKTLSLRLCIHIPSVSEAIRIPSVSEARNLIFQKIWFLRFRLFIVLTVDVLAKLAKPDYSQLM